jgi:ribosomal protein S18 acetylase RimI-like enzyme
MGELVYTTLRPDLVARCAALELATFPHADPDELLTEDDIGAYCETFPDGFFVVLDGDEVVAQGAGIYLNFDFDDPQHTIIGITGEHQCGNHRPDNDWYYGTDIAVNPAYRRRGIGRRLYGLRKELVIRDGKKGIIAGGYLPGYADHKDEMSAQQYVDAVVAGDIYDPTLSFQLSNGFEVRGLLEDYLADEHTDGWASLIVWENPEVARG